MVQHGIAIHMHVYYTSKKFGGFISNLAVVRDDQQPVKFSSHTVVDVQ